MSWTWAVLVGVTPILVAVCRDLTSLYCHVVRRASVERIVRECTGAIRIVDRTAEGDVLEIEVLPSGEDFSSLDSRSAKA